VNPDSHEVSEFLKQDTCWLFMKQWGSWWLWK